MLDSTTWKRLVVGLTLLVTASTYFALSLVDTLGEVSLSPANLVCHQPLLCTSTLSRNPKASPGTRPSGL